MLTDTSKTGQRWWSPNALCRQSTTGDTDQRRRTLTGDRDRAT
jgi:hypothetical protein